MFLMNADGSILEAKQLRGKVIIIIYFPDCDHCEREATEIRNNIKAFDSYDLWFLSTAEFPDIQKFSVDYKFADQANVHFAKIQPKDVYGNFGAIPTPSVYIYSESKKLIREIKGETPIANILMYL
jgi:peroxiredoxin